MPAQMAVGQALLIGLKNLLYHVVCLGNEPRYFILKSRVVLAAARLGAYEAAYFHLLPVFIRPGSDVVDVGANIGAYTTVMARLVGPAGRVFAFEPLPATADILARTCQHQTNVVIVREALSDGARDALELRVPFLAGGVPEPALAAADPAARAEDSLPTWKTFRVPVRRLDDHLAGFRDISFIKVDVEGHERAFLSGATETIRRFRPVLQLETSGLRGDVAIVEQWTRVAQYVLLAVRGGRLEVASPETLLGLNVYGVPEEMMTRLPENLLHRPHAA
jgi:FkbM family methyltransferase